MQLQSQHPELEIKYILCFCFGNTVKPEYNSHPWDPKEVSVDQNVVVGQRLVLYNFVVILAGLGIQAGGC
jgi:hypothetical protein